MKKVLFLFFCCGIFVLGCKNVSNDVDEISFDEAINEKIENSKDKIDENNKQKDKFNSDELTKALKEGMEQREAGNFEVALNIYTNAISKNNSNASLYADRGRVKKEIGDLEGALEDINKALELSQEAWIYAERANVYKMMGENKLSLQDFKKALSMDSSMIWIVDNIKELELM